MPDLHLSRITLPLRSGPIQRLLSDCHAMHRFVMSAFPDVPDEAARQSLGVLYRVERQERRPHVRVLVQSRATPLWAFESNEIRAEGPASLDALMAGIAPGRRYRFRLHANPTRRVHRRAATGPDAREQASAIGKRVAVRDEQARLIWLERKGAVAGFALLQAEVSPGLESPAEAYEGFPAARSDPAGVIHGRQSRTLPGGSIQNRFLSFETCIFEGVLEVRDAGALRAGIVAGIGAGKAFGCGLLSLAPV
jgi:CRISPR system Cascade subunit CasE